MHTQPIFFSFLMLLIFPSALAQYGETNLPQIYGTDSGKGFVYIPPRSRAGSALKFLAEERRRNPGRVLFPNCSPSRRSLLQRSFADYLREHPASAAPTDLRSWKGVLAQYGVSGESKSTHWSGMIGDKVTSPFRTKGQLRELLACIYGDGENTVGKLDFRAVHTSLNRSKRALERGFTQTENTTVQEVFGANRESYEALMFSVNVVMALSTSPKLPQQTGEITYLPSQLDQLRSDIDWLVNHNSRLETILGIEEKSESLEKAIQLISKVKEMKITIPVKSENYDLFMIARRDEANVDATLARVESSHKALVGALDDIDRNLEALFLKGALTCMNLDQCDGNAGAAAKMAQSLYSDIKSVVGRLRRTAGIMQGDLSTVKEKFAVSRERFKKIFQTGNGDAGK